MRRFLSLSFIVGILAVSSATVSSVSISTPVLAQSSQTSQSDRIAIQRAIIKHLGTTGSQPIVDRITIQHPFALANWLKGEAGGTLAAIYRNGQWKIVSFGGGMPTAQAMSQRTGIPLPIADSLLKQHFKSTTSSTTEVPMTLSWTEEMLAISVHDGDTTRSAYGGKLRLYDVHIAKMFEVTHVLCQDFPGMGEWTWTYLASEGSIRMGGFRISCNLARDIVRAYGLGKSENTLIRIANEEKQGYRELDVPILNITGRKVDRWMAFTRRFKPHF